MWPAIIIAALSLVLLAGRLRRHRKSRFTFFIEWRREGDDESK